MISIIEDIAEYKIKKNFQLDKPKGVRGRSSDNTLVENKINWRPGYNLRQGLKETYKWIYDELKSGSNIQKFIRK